jgi:hypothetical protein
MLEACEPVFVFVCQMNRMRHMRAKFDVSRLQRDAMAALEQAKANAEAMGLGDEFNVAEPGNNDIELSTIGVHRTLCHLIDDTAWRFDGQLRQAWKQISAGAPYHDQGWADLFFKHLEYLLDNPADQTRGRREVMLRALELGFNGDRNREPQTLNDYMGRLRDSLGIDDSARSLPALITGKPFIEEKAVEPPPSVRIKQSGVTLVAIIGFVIIAYFGAFYFATLTVKQTTKAIQDVYRVRLGNDKQSAEPVTKKSEPKPDSDQGTGSAK